MCLTSSGAFFISLFLNTCKMSQLEKDSLGKSVQKLRELLDALELEVQRMEAVMVDSEKVAVKEFISAFDFPDRKRWAKMRGKN